MGKRRAKERGGRRGGREEEEGGREGGRRRREEGEGGGRREEGGGRREEGGGRRSSRTMNLDEVRFGRGNDCPSALLCPPLPSSASSTLLCPLACGTAVAVRSILQAAPPAMGCKQRLFSSPFICGIPVLMRCRYRYVMTVVSGQETAHRPIPIGAAAECCCNQWVDPRERKISWERERNRNENCSGGNTVVQGKTTTILGGEH